MSEKFLKGTNIHSHCDFKKNETKSKQGTNHFERRSQKYLVLYIDVNENVSII